MKFLSSLKRTVLTIALCVAPFCAIAQDSQETRQAAADRYLKAVPVSKMISDMIGEIAQQLPESQRAEFTTRMKAVMRADAIERIARESIVKTFTTDEIIALADFYGSPNGASAMQKFGTYFAQVMPTIQEEIKQAVQRVQKPSVSAIKDCDVCPGLVSIPGGSFEMGANDCGEDAQPVHHVNVNSFLLGQTAVTYGQWKAVMGASSRSISQCGDECPVSQVSWEDAQMYVTKLSERTGKRYRLPSEAEWEYAARAGSTGRWSFGDDEDQLDRHAWFGFNSFGRTQIVGQKKANAFGLFDMYGNVWQWVQDVWHPSYHGAPTDGSAWMDGGDGELRVLRGGAWFDKPVSLQSAYRSWNTSVMHYYGAGLRVARDGG